MKSFDIKNIKGFIDSGEIDIKPLTIFIGKNSSGKSSLARFLVVLRQTLLSLKDSPLVFFDENKGYVDYGEFGDVVYNSNTEKEISFSIKIDKSSLVKKDYYIYSLGVTQEDGIDEDYSDEDAINMKDLFKRYLAAIDFIKLELTIVKDSKKLVISNFKCMAGDSNILIDLTRKEDAKYSLKIFAEDIVYNIAENAVMFENFIPSYRIFDLKYPKWEKQKVMFLYELLYIINLYLKEVAKRIQYIGPFREAPQRYYRHEEETYQFVGIKGEAAPAILAEDYKKDKKIINGISEWLRENLNVELYVDDMEGNFSIMIRDIESNGVDNNLMDVGYGLAQLVPILVEIFYKKNKKEERNNLGITLVEQPELHLHPAAQAALADLFINASDNNNRFLIETHSENLILRLRRRIAETPSLKEHIVLYYVEKTKEGNSQVTKLEIDENGDISNWPKGLLSEDFYELLELKKAAQKNNTSVRGEFDW